MSAFELIPPPALKLPAPKKGELPFYDDTRPLGERCLWRIEFLCENLENPEYALHVKPRQWKIEGEYPDAYILAQLQDLACGRVGAYAQEAILLYFRHGDITEPDDTKGGELDHWRFISNMLFQKAFAEPVQRVSPNNPPPDRLIMNRARM